MLPIRHIGAAVDEALEYIDQRNAQEVKPLDTGFDKLNDILLGGLEWGRILTIAALSGGGKSITLEQLKKNIIEKNRDQDFDFLCFDWEMPSTDQIVRNIIGDTDIDVRALYGVDMPLSELMRNKVELSAEKIKGSPVYICDTPGTPQDV